MKEIVRKKLKKLEEKEKKETRLLLKNDKRREEIFKCLTRRICFNCAGNLKEKDGDIWWPISDCAGGWSYFIICPHCGLEEIEDSLGSLTLEKIKERQDNKKKKLEEKRKYKKWWEFWKKGTEE